MRKGRAVLNLPIPLIAPTTKIKVLGGIYRIMGIGFRDDRCAKICNEILSVKTFRDLAGPDYPVIRRLHHHGLTAAFRYKNPHHFIVGDLHVHTRDHIHLAIFAGRILIGLLVEVQSPDGPVSSRFGYRNGYNGRLI